MKRVRDFFIGEPSVFQSPIRTPGKSANSGARVFKDSITALGWNGLGSNFPEGAHVSVEGVYQGHEVYVQVLAYAPEDEEPGMKVDATNTPRRPK